MCICGYLKTNVLSRIFKLGAGMFWNVGSVARLGTRSGESQRVAISGQRFALTRCQVFFLPLNLVSFIVSFSLSLQVCTKTIVVSLLRGVSNMWSLLFGLSLAIFYKSLSPHAELEGLMAVLARAVIYIHIDRNKQIAINSGQRQTSVTIILDNLFIQDFVCQLQLLCSIVDTLH